MNKLMILNVFLLLGGCVVDNGYYDNYGHYHYYDDNHKKGNIDNRWDGDHSQDWKPDANHDAHNYQNHDYNEYNYERNRDNERGPYHDWDDHDRR